MLQLKFSAYNFRFKNTENKIYIFDIIRKKFVVLQPEEWVRQHWIHHLIEDKKYPKSLISIEKQLIINSLKKRYDIVVFNSDGTIRILVECKAPKIKIDQATFDQMARYNMNLKSTYLVVSNGLEHFYCKMNHKEEKYLFLKDIPIFSR